MLPVLLLAVIGADPSAPMLPDYEAALNDRLGKGITPERNANALLWKALGPTPDGQRLPPEFFKRLGIPEPPKEGTYFVPLGAYAQDHLKLTPAEINAIQEELLTVTQRPWTVSKYPRHFAWLKANEKPLEIVVEAVKRPDYFNPLISHKDGEQLGSLIDTTSQLTTYRGFAAALTARAMFRVAVQRYDDAWADLLTCHRLGRQIARGGTLIECLVGMAVEQLAVNAELAYLDSAALTPKQIQEHLKDLHDLPPAASLADQIDLGERAMIYESARVIPRYGLGWVDSMIRWEFDAAQEARRKVLPEEQKALVAIDWVPAIKFAEKWQDQMVAAARLKTRTDRLRAFDAIEAELRALQKDAGSLADVRKDLLAKNDRAKEAGTRIQINTLVGCMSSFRKVLDASDRIEQVRTNHLVAFALAAYPLDNKRYPDTLGDLAPKYLPAVPGDLFSGKALIYRLAEKGYLLYSVGINGKDEEGRWYDDTPPGDDPRVRMPLPELKPTK